MNLVFGIHIGNTNASIAYCRDGHVEMIVNEAGDRITPAVVRITDEETIVGAAAKTAIISKCKTTIYGNKELFNMEKNYLEKLDHHKNVQTIMKNGEIQYCIPIDEKFKFVSPQNIVTFILQKLYNTANSTRNESEDRLSCVLLVPQSFSDESCEIYKIAAEAAGWNILQIINETAAAVLAYSLLDDKESLQNVLVYRLGGTVCEVVVYELCDGMLYSLGSEHSKEIGGVHFTNILAKYLADEFYRKYNLDITENRRSMYKLKLASENCVHILSKMQTANCFIESLQEGVDFSITVSRARFELLIQPFLAKLTEPITVLLNKLHLDGPIDKLVMCGGATNVPKLQSNIMSLFDTSITQMLNHLNADEVLALGAAKQAYYLLDNEIMEFLPRSHDISTDSKTECLSTGNTSCSSDDEN